LPECMFLEIRVPKVTPIRREPERVERPASSRTIKRRARAYVAKCEPAVSGSGGHSRTFAVARSLIGWVRDQGLSDDDAWDLLLEYNERCLPPWSERELEHKWQSALAAHTVPTIENRDRVADVVPIVRDVDPEDLVDGITPPSPELEPEAPA